MSKKLRTCYSVVIALSAFCSLFYLLQIFHPFIVAHGNVGLARWGADYYVRWEGTRGVLMDRIDPYSQEATARIQTGYYGAPLAAGSDEDPQPFNYPGHAVLVFSPFSLFTYSTARILMLIVLTFCTLSSLLVWLKILDVERLYLLPICVFAITSWQFVEALYLEQPTLLVAFLLSVAVYSSWKHHFFLGGCLLALSTIKPQMAWPCVLWLLLWSSGRIGGKKALGGFAVTLGSMTAVSEWLIPGWPTEWFKNVRAYASHTGARLSFQFLLGPSLGLWVTTLVVLIGAYLLWRNRMSEPDSEGFRYSIALVYALTMLLMPRSSWHSYEEVQLFPVAIYLGMRLKNFKSESAFTGITHLLSLFVIFWPFPATAVLTVMRLLGANLNVEPVLRAPTYGFFLVAPITTVAFLLLKERQHETAGPASGAGGCVSNA